MTNVITNVTTSAFPEYHVLVYYLPSAHESLRDRSVTVVLSFDDRNSTQQLGTRYVDRNVVSECTMCHLT